MKEIAPIQFRDADSNEETVAIVRASRERVALCLSLRHDGDIEVQMKKEKCSALIEALQKAVSTP